MARRLLTDQQRIDWLRLIRSANVGPSTFRELINHFGSARAALDALPDLARRGGAGPIKASAAAAAEEEISRAEDFGGHLVAIGEPGYPAWLARVDAPPPLIFVKGRLELADEPMVAIVGARNGSALGQKLTRMLAVDFGRAGLVVASGLARGIDSAAHRAALDKGTVAVVAGGIDFVYPPENADLQEAISERGLLLSERPMGFRPKGKDFPRRNRLISGVAAAVVVVEAARRSGSLITARLAGEQGRDVFAVPGNPLDPRAEGTNGLLRDGAGLVTRADDVIEALQPVLRRPADPAGGALEDADGADRRPAVIDIGETDRERIISMLSVAPVDIDEVIRASDCAARDVQVILLELDLAGRLERHGQQRVSLIR